MRFFIIRHYTNAPYFYFCFTLLQLQENIPTSVSNVSADDQVITMWLMSHLQHRWCVRSLSFSWLTELAELQVPVWHSVTQSLTPLQTQSLSRTSFNDNKNIKRHSLHYANNPQYRNGSQTLNKRNWHGIIFFWNQFTASRISRLVFHC